MINKTENDTKQELVKKSSTSLQTTESLPVLTAFSDFIKSEQRRSRNRMLIMGFLFTIMILIVIGAGIFVGTAFYNQVHADLRQTKNDLSSYHIKNEIEKSKNKEKLAKIQALASNIAQNISMQEKALQKTQNALDSSTDSYKQELANMKQVIDSLSRENKKLKKDSEQANIQLPQLSAQLNELLNIINNPVEEPKVTVTTEENDSKDISEPKKLPEIIKQAEPIETKESVATIKNTTSIELNIDDQEDDSDIMMLLPALE